MGEEKSLMEQQRDLIGKMTAENVEEISVKAKELIDKAEGEEQYEMMMEAETIGMMMNSLRMEKGNGK